MSVVTIKGQVTIPKPVRDMLGVKPGNKVVFRSTSEGAVIIEREDRKRPISRIASFRGHAGPGATTDELMALLRGDS